MNGRQRKVSLNVNQIADWATAHRRRTGQWPSMKSGKVIDAPQEKSWSTIHNALKDGYRGLPGGDSLTRLLEREVGRRPGRQLPVLTDEHILDWADAHQRQFGRWPTCDSGPVVGERNLSWAAIDHALKRGFRGLKSGRTLSSLLGEKRNVHRQAHLLRKLTVRQILAWADDHRRQTGRWPRPNSGRIEQPPYMSWGSISNKLFDGECGAPKGTTIQRLLVAKRGAPFRSASGAKLSIPEILRWADEYHEKRGKWPRYNSGVVAGQSELTWLKIHTALTQGGRGLPKCGSLAQLLQKRRGVRNRRDLPRLTMKQVAEWVIRHHRRTGAWPTKEAGPIADSPEDTWSAVDYALKEGARSLPSGSSLFKLVNLIRPDPRAPGGHQAALKVAEVIRWAEAHHRRTGRWPNGKSGAVAEAPDVTWGAINAALHYGLRGLRGGSSLARLLQKKFGRTVRIGRRKGALTLSEIVLWGKAHHRRTGEWPDPYSGRVLDARGEIWFEIDEALRNGWRGLSGSSSLQKLFSQRTAPKPLPIRHRSGARYRPIL